MSITAENVTLTKGITLTVGQQYYVIGAPTHEGAETPTQMYYLGTEWINNDHSADLEGQTKRLVFDTSASGNGLKKFNVCQGEIFVYSSSSDASTAASSMYSWMTTNNITCGSPAMQCPWGLNSGCAHKDEVPRKWNGSNQLTDKNNNVLFSGQVTKS